MCEWQCTTFMVMLPLVDVTIRGKGQENGVQTLALLDLGSNKTLCSNALVNQLGEEGTALILSIVFDHTEL